MKRNLTPIILGFLVLAIGSRLSTHFLEWAYLRDSMTLVAELGLIALAMNFVIATGQIDLSVGSNMVLTACLTAKLLNANIPPPVAMAFGVAIGAVLGYVNGFLITFFQAPSFLITVATLAIFRGAAKAMLGPSSLKIPADLVGVDTLTLAGLTVPLWILVVLTLAFSFVINCTVLGRQVIAVGSNPRNALYSGVPVDRTIRIAFTLTGLISGVAAALMLSRLGLARPDLANGAELDIITIVVVGGTLIQGGYANVFGSLFAFILIALLRTAMGVASITAEYQMTIIGALLICVVLAKRINIRIPSQKRATSGNKPS